MPAKSENQQEAMGIAHAIQEGKVKSKPGTPSAEIAKTMKPADVKEFASTPRKELPEHAQQFKFQRSKKYRPKVKMVGEHIQKMPFPKR